MSKSVTLGDVLASIHSRIYSGEIQQAEMISGKTPEAALDRLMDAMRAEIEALKAENEALRRKINKEN